MIEMIAELAQGFEGNPHQAELLARGALKGGADAVKFQLVYADELATPDYEYYQLFRQLELDTQVWHKISRMIHDQNRRLYFDVFGPRSLEIANEVKADGIKLSTTEFYNEELMRKALTCAPRLFISIGGIPTDDIEALIQREQLQPSQKICFMYGFQAEPTPLENNHLMRFESLRRRFAGFQFGFMDHSLGGDAEEATILPLMAMVGGISCIEKHLTLDYALELEDYVSAITPTRFANLVRLVRKFEKALGSAELQLTGLEKEYANKATKVAVALQPVPKGTTLHAHNVGLKRTGKRPTSGGTFRRLSEVLGQKAGRDFQVDEPVTELIM